MMRKLPHPGFGIRDLSEDAGMSVTDAARKLGVTRQALNNLVTGRAGISPEMAIRLASLLLINTVIEPGAYVGCHPHGGK